MSAPLTAAEWQQVLASTGDPVVYVDGWQTRTRNSGGSFSAHCIRIHCTGGGDTADPATYNRNVILGDPLVSFKSHVLIGRDCKIYMNGTGRANDIDLAGAASWQALMDGTWPITPGYHDLRGQGAGNPGSIGYGFEIQGLRVTQGQLAVAARLAAAICRHYGWTAGSIAGHGEIAADRTYADPGVDTGAFRVAVHQLLTTTTSEEDDDMPLSDADIAKIAAAVWNQPITLADASGKPTTTKWPAWHLLEHSRRMLAAGGGIAGQLVTALQKAAIVPVYHADGKPAGSWSLTHVLSNIRQALTANKESK